MIYGYARVSTKIQIQGTSLEEQEMILKKNGCKKVFKDVYTGTKMDRPEFDKLMDVLQPGDTVIVTKLDRIGRTSIEGYQTVKRMVDAGVTVNIMNVGIIDISNATGKAILQVFLAFAEMERDLIVERCQGGRAYKRKTDPDYRDGRKPTPKVQIVAALEDLERMTYKEAAARHGISESTLYRAARKAGVRRL